MGHHHAGPEGHIDAIATPPGGLTGALQKKKKI
jgi:hypothetical protein